MFYKHESITELRKFQRIIPLRRYEKFATLPDEKAIELAQKALKNGLSYPNMPHLNINMPIPWEDKTGENRSLSFRLHCWDHLDVLLAAYDATKDQKYLLLCINIAKEWIAKFGNLETDSEFAWYDMSVGLRSYRLAYITDAALRLESIDDQTLENLRNSIQIHASNLLNDKNIRFHNNHGFYQVAGQLAMAQRLQHFMNDTSSFRQATERFHRMLHHQFSDEGIHLEHSPDYYRMVYLTLRGIIQARLVEQQDAIEFARLMEENLAWFVLPNGRIVNFGDSDYRNMFLAEKNAKSWNYPPMQYITSKGFLGTPPKETILAAKKSGYFVAVDSWPQDTEQFHNRSYLAQIACFHSRTHKHADDLSIIWYDRENEILVDSGRFGYFGKTEPGSDLWDQGFWYSNPWRVYVESTRAHNTVEIDGMNYQRRKTKPYGSAIRRWGRTEDDIYFCESSVLQFGSILHTRLIMCKFKEWLLVFDSLWDKKKQPHDFRQWFHFAPQIELIRTNSGYSGLIGEQEQPICITSLFGDPFHSEIYHGMKEPMIQGWVSPKEGSIHPNAAIAFEQKAVENTNFATILSFSNELKPDLEWARVNVTGRKGRFRWCTETGKTDLVFSRMEEEDINIQYIS